MGTFVHYIHMYDPSPTHPTHAQEIVTSVTYIFLIYIHNYLLNSLCYCILKKGNFIYRNFMYFMLCNFISLRCKSCKTYYYYCHMQLHSFLLHYRAYKYIQIPEVGACISSPFTGSTPETAAR